MWDEVLRDAVEARDAREDVELFIEREELERRLEEAWELSSVDVREE